MELITDGKLMINFKKNIKPIKVKDWSTFNIDFINAIALINNKVVRYDIEQLYHIHRVYRMKVKNSETL
ncbi:MAG: hypothetical protein DRJ49_04510 [Thermoprotei archaeon]|nr:MAG: hypothetical protein DRJ49_04510 [Thermoprotei archaeon]